MKTLLLFLILFLNCNNIFNSNIKYEYKYNIIITDHILEAIIETESNGRNIAGKTGDVGILQETIPFVDCVNNILGYNAYTYNDRWSKLKSIEMYYIYQHYFIKKYNLVYNLKNASLIHHGSIKEDEQNRYFNKCNSMYLKLITKNCSDKHKGMIMPYIHSAKNIKHQIVEIETKDINTGISYLNSQSILFISLSPTLLNIPNNIGTLIKNLI